MGMCVWGGGGGGEGRGVLRVLYGSGGPTDPAVDQQAFGDIVGFPSPLV